MPANTTPLVRRLELAFALSLSLIGACASAAPTSMATPSGRDDPPTLSSAAIAGRQAGRCAPPAQRTSAASMTLAGDDPSTARAPDAAATTVALGGTFCRWVCYPGSGCEYQCRFFPQ